MKFGLEPLTMNVVQHPADPRGHLRLLDFRLPQHRHRAVADLHEPPGDRVRDALILIRQQPNERSDLGFRQHLPHLNKRFGGGSIRRKAI